MSKNKMYSNKSGNVINEETFLTLNAQLKAKYSLNSAIKVEIPIEVTTTKKGKGKAEEETTEAID